MATFFFQSGERLDADDALGVDPQFTATVAAHPLEVGSDMSDHVSPNPMKASLDLIFTPDAAGRENVLPLPGPGRPAAAVSRLARACAKGEVLTTVIFAQYYWENVALTSVSPPVSFGDGDGRTVRVELQVLQMAEARAVQVAVVPRRRKLPKTSGPIKPALLQLDAGLQPSIGVYDNAEDAAIIANIRSQFDQLGTP